ncbi:hypothetical protein PZ895_07595 [Mesorhizobium sp. YIM 152430]|uniref:hypothetical protein n=1 Tax=Mesorhizobium sp. YIM 152430 TaxID=3031761 RepID=UPI0023DA1985|nr:hypothetical protein [Mesorhizobium sp. YIM 152430]MDF1599638.1 hypothetical protein [Mesorhizobium sp. YIM 152430]
MGDLWGAMLPWLPAVGIALNVLGVAIVALEWRVSLYDGLSRAEMEQSLLAVSNGHEPHRELELSPLAMRVLKKVDWAEIASDQDRFDAFMHNILILDTVERLNRRRTIFGIGFAVIILGSVLQFVSALPG